MYHYSVIQPIQTSTQSQYQTHSETKNQIKLTKMHLQIQQQPNISKIPQKDEQFPQQQILESIKQDKLCRIDKVRTQDITYILKRINSTQVQLNKSLKINIQHQIQACTKFMYKNKNSDPFVIKYYQIWQTPLYYNILMQWCDCQTLEQYMLKDRIANSRSQICVIFMLEILYGLTACHQRGIAMHRDLKPSNIFVTHKLTQLRVKIGDFGVCTDQNYSKNFQGTNLYLAPQVFAIKNKWMPYKFVREYGYNSNCDIWSLGMICYQLYSGVNKNNKLTFPFIPNIEKLMTNRQETIKYTRLFYEQCVNLEVTQNKDQVKKSFLIFKQWKSLSQVNRKRMKIYILLINKMLWPNPLGRISTVGLYQLINIHRAVLFAGELQNHSIVLKFDEYFNKQRKNKTSSSQIYNMSTVLT